MPHERRTTSSARLRVVAPLEGADDTNARLDRAIAGDTKAWTDLYLEHFDTVLRFVAYSTGDVSVAEDITQEAFAQALVGLSKFDRRAPFVSWMRGIAMNLVRKHWRKRERRSRAYDRLGQVATKVNDGRLDDDLLSQRRAEALAAALDTLPPHLREAFVLSDVHGMAASEAAKEFGITAGNFRVRAARARARLREHLQGLGLIETEALG